METTDSDRAAPPMKFALIIFSAFSLYAAGSVILRGSTSSTPVRFTDFTKQSGIHFRHNAGKAGHKFLPETMGAGLALLDFNNDGRLDIFFVNGRDWNASGRKTPCALY